MKQRLQFIKALFLEETLQLLFAAIIFSLSYSPWFPYFSRLLSDYTIDRTYMFLLCNGILVILGVSSPFQLTATDSQAEFFSLDGVYSVNYVVEKEADQVPSPGHIKYVTQQDKDKEEDVAEEGIGFAVKNGLEEEQNGYWVTEQVHDEEEIEEYYNDCDVEKGGHGLLTTEELNKKFDDFIRKMKEEIRFGAQTQLIMV